jgi:hypothetical protein
MPVSFEHPDYGRFVKKWRRCQDVFDGQDAIHDAGEEYLPRLKDQTEEDYQAYKGRATFYNATYRTISGLVGMMFKRPPKIEVPPAIEEMLKDVTLSGVELQVFAQLISTEALKKGRVGILVDCPTVKNAEGREYITLADQLEQGVRPSLQMYVAESIINWKTTRVDNMVVLSMVVLKEQMAETKDEFEDKMVDVYRVLDMDGLFYRVRLFRRTQERKDEIVAAAPRTPAGVRPAIDPTRANEGFEQIGEDLFPLMDGEPMTYIPFVFMSAEDLEPNASDPPLIDLVNLNLSHYRTTADYEHGAHFTGLPTPWISGHTQENKNEKLYVGSSHAWVFPRPETRVGYLEFGGQGLGTLKEVLDRKEQQMAILGARMLEPQKRGVEKPEAMSIYRKGEESTLSMVAQTVSMGLERALKWFAEWAGADPKNLIFEINRNFLTLPMDAGMLSSLVSGWQMGAFSDRTLFDNLQRGEVISDEKTFEEEQTEIQEGAQRMRTIQETINPPPPMPEDLDEDEQVPPNTGGNF